MSAPADSESWYDRMKTYVDCIPCFFKQALEAARIAGADEYMQREIMNDVARTIPSFSMDASPPVMARTIYSLVRERTQIEDPYLDIKNKSNHMALGLAEQIRKKLDASADRLLTAVELAIAGNIIDFGAKNRLNVHEELEKLMAREEQTLHGEAAQFFQYEVFQNVLQHSKTILYLADNAGEVFFDRVLLEEIKRIDAGKEILYAVKEKPAINDAMTKDAVDCGVNRVARIISSGSDAPGTLLSGCPASFRSVFEQADMVISKGQGNYETLSGTGRRIFFLLLAKCPVIADNIGCRIGDVLLVTENGRQT